MPHGPFVVPTSALHITTVCLALLLACQFWHLVMGYRASDRVFPQRTRWMLVIVITLGAALSYMLSLNRAVLAFEIAVAFVLCFLDPFVAVSVLVGFFLMRPWELVPAHPLLELLPRSLAGGALLSWLFHSASQGKVRIHWDESIALLVALLVWLLAAALFSQTPHQSASVWLESFIPVMAIVFLIHNGVRTEGQLRLMQRTISISVLCIVCVALMLGALDKLQGEWIYWSRDGRAQGAGMWSNSNDLAALITIALPLVLISQGRSFGGKLVDWAVGIVLLVCLWFTQSRGALLGLGLGAAALAFTRSSRRAARWAVVLGGLGLVALLFVSITRGSEELSESSAARLNYLVTGIRMASDYPLFGVGLGNYPSFYERYSTQFHEWGERTAHSSWTLVLAESGVIGLLLFASFYGAVFLRAWRARKVYPEIFAAVVSYGVAFSFLSHSYLLPPYVLAALVIAASRLSRVEGAHG